MSDTPPGVWTAELDRRARELAWLVLDVDGVLTDGRLHFGPNGELFKSFHVRDGLAIQQARAAGLRVAILSARSSAIVARRAAELGVDEVLQGSPDKGAALADLLTRHAATAAQCAFMGDDLPDLSALALAGLAAAPSDAAVEARAAAHFVTERAGGAGCVRELVDRILTARGEPPVEPDRGA